jgi:serine/threonine protein kinase
VRLLLQRHRRHGAEPIDEAAQARSAKELIDGLPASPRSDLYSLAAVAYYALLGSPPFPGLTVEQVLAKQTTNQLPTSRGLRDDVNAALEQVLDRALSADVSRRYPSAAEFLQALNHAVGAPAREPVADWARAAARWFRGSPLD